MPVRTPAAPVVSISIDRTSAIALAAQISGQIRDLVQSGAVAAGDRLPSSRALAAELGVARGVVELAFDQLLAEGWVHARRGAGTFVAEGVGSAGAGVRRTDRRDRPARPTIAPDTPLVLDTGTPWVDRRHEAAWRRAWRTVASSTPPAQYPDPAGLSELRAAVAEHLGRHRGMACTADHVMITSGTAHGLALLLDELDPGPVGLEDPGYRAAAATIVAGGRSLVDVDVDVDGISLPKLATTGRLAAVYVTPAHQHPLGMPMAASTRVGLIAEARRRDFLVVEDDYDSEFRYDVAPLPALATMDPDRVVYLGTTSKSLTPALRIGWLVTTPDRVERLARRRGSRHDHPSWPMQRALLSLIAEGYVDRQIRSARRLYAERSRMVRDRLGRFGSTGPSVAGMYITLQTSAAVADKAVSTAAAAGVVVPSLSDYCRTASRHGLVLGFGGVGDGDLQRALDVVEQALEEAVEHFGPVA